MNENREMLSVKFTLNDESLCIKSSGSNGIHWSEKNMKGLAQDSNTGQMIFYWVLKEIKPLFYTLPVETVHVEMTEECKTRLGGVIQFCHKCLTNTNNTIKKYTGLKNAAAQNEKVLFFNVNDNVNLKKFYEQLDLANSHKLLYKSFNPGFNLVTRQWEKTDPPITVDEFVLLIQDQELGKIVSINHYLLEKYFDQGIYLIALFEYLGVEYVIFDHDPWDDTLSGHLTKSFYNCDSFTRFSYSYAHKFWDRHYKLKNVHHVALTNEYPKKYVPEKLPDDYNIVIMTNARVQNVLHFLNPILFLLSHFKTESFFDEVELWYYSLRFMILEIMDLNEFERLQYNSLLANMIYAISQFVKYDVIDSIDSERRIELYGDQGWNHVFPELYKTYLDRKSIDELIARKESLYLLMNIQTTWLESSAAVFEAINYQLPFINHPALVKSQELSGLSNLEYRNSTELNDRINDINSYTNEEAISSIRFLNDISNDCMSAIGQAVNKNELYRSENNNYGVQLNIHDGLLSQKIHQYIDKNEHFLRYTFKSLFKESVKLNVEKSEYFPKEYMQRLLHYAQTIKK